MLRRSLVLCLVGAFVWCGAAAAQTGSPLSRRLARALRAPQVSPARTGALVVDLATGKVLFQQHASLPLAPASNEKLAVTYASLELLGADFRMSTEVLGAGAQEGSIWRGNLVLKGYGDPALDRVELRALAGQIKALGIRRVTGRIVGDESFFDDHRTAPGWKASFFLTECEPLSALVVDRDRVGNRFSRTPAASAAAAMSSILRASGVRVAGVARRGVAPAVAVPLAAVESPPLWKVIRFMNRESDNFTAELLLKQLGAQYGAAGTTGAGAAVVARVLSLDGIPVAGVRIVDGSGLSRLDRLTPRAVVAILEAAWSSAELRGAFVGSLAVAGVYGTLRNRMTRAPARGQVLGKTGTTDASSALSGFVRGRYAFSILTNGAPVTSWWARRAQDRFATVLARLH
jgi:serine-type D-Ala-D-Ala carboxypeptidase/endopeptidase (penicillin-binding protein 4)